jgi:sigma-54 specific flagellar transcriptional regulator A
VRELANLLERLAILSPDQTVTAADLPERYRTTGAGAWPDGGVSFMPDAVRLMPDLDDCDASDLIADREAGESLSKSGGIDLKDHMSAIEIGLIRRALEEADGTVAEAARLLNIRRTTLVEKLRKYRLSA